MKPDIESFDDAKSLLVLRHAKSSWKDPGLDDYDRPLNKRGKRDCARMGALIQEADLIPELILSSSARRVRDTVQRVAEACEFDGEVRLEESLYSFGATPYLAALATLEDEYRHVMIVGHNPGLEELVELLTGEYARLPTASLAWIRLSFPTWNTLMDEAEIEGELLRLWRPREL